MILHLAASPVIQTINLTSSESFNITRHQQTLGVQLTMEVTLSDLVLGGCITQLGVTMSYVEVDIVKVEVAVCRKRQSPNDNQDLWERKTNVCVNERRVVRGGTERLLS